jgi:hypothetical protein
VPEKMMDEPLEDPGDIEDPGDAEPEAPPPDQPR